MNAEEISEVYLKQERVLDEVIQRAKAEAWDEGLMAERSARAASAALEMEIEPEPNPYR